uniref:Uncharacterized protein n=1 Tax=Oryza meridionalis TaxID=40149 RepID=A0A0E0DDL6_9ORYZ
MRRLVQLCTIYLIRAPPLSSLLHRRATGKPEARKRMGTLLAYVPVPPPRAGCAAPEPSPPLARREESKRDGDPGDDRVIPRHARLWSAPKIRHVRRAYGPLITNRAGKGLRMMCGPLLLAQNGEGGGLQTAQQLELGIGLRIKLGWSPCWRQGSHHCYQHNRVVELRRSPHQEEIIGAITVSLVGVEDSRPAQCGAHVNTEVARRLDAA